jgi:hypothetical protein
VIAVQTLTENGRPAAVREQRIVAPRHEDPLRAQAIERIHQLRRLKVHLVAFALGLPLLGGLWVLTEYFEEHTWPSRFASDPDVAGTWDPWFFFVAGIWALVLVAHALKVYLGPSVGPVGRYVRRPVTEAEVDRALKRIHR